MRELVDPEVETYLQRVGGHAHPVLKAMEEEAGRQVFPIVGPLVGRFLAQLVQMTGARRILELGSGFGYSAFWFSLAAGRGARIYLTEYEADNLEAARRWFEAGGLESRFEYLQGDALKLLDFVEGTFDIIFNDVDKQSYPEVFHRARTRLRPGGLLVSDNVLWHGHVLDADPDEDTRAVLEYTRLIFNDPEFCSSIVPLRDGVSVSVRK